MYQHSQWRIQETGKGGSKLSSAKCEELNPRTAHKIWGYAHFRCSKTRENPILSQGKSHLRLRGTAANSHRLKIDLEHSLDS